MRIEGCHQSCAHLETSGRKRDSEECMHPISIAALFIIARLRKPPSVHQQEEWIKGRYNRNKVEYYSTAIAKGTKWVIYRYVDGLREPCLE